MADLSKYIPGLPKGEGLPLTAVGEGTATDLQGILEELDARITALEEAP